jgi:hypothetical protein
MQKNKKSQFFPEEQNDSGVDEIYDTPQRRAMAKYRKTKKGKKAAIKARKKYDDRDPERRRRQKREYMKRKRAEKRASLKGYF